VQQIYYGIFAKSLTPCLKVHTLPFSAEKHLELRENLFISLMLPTTVPDKYKCYNINLCRAFTFLSANVTKSLSKICMKVIPIKMVQETLSIGPKSLQFLYAMLPD